MSLDVFPAAQFVFNEDIKLLPSATYLVVQPTFEFGDYTCVAPITSNEDDPEQCQLRIGLPDRPPTTVACYRTFADALDAALNLQEKRRELTLWCNCHEMISEISGWRDLGLQLVEHPGVFESFERIMSAYDAVRKGDRAADDLDEDDEDGEAVLKTILAGEEPEGSDLLITAIRRALAE